MIQKATLQFLKKLKQNNNRDWFEANRKEYEAAKNNIEVFATTLLKHLAKKHEGFGQLTYKDCMFRINRDVRFSKDKSPYKTNMGIYLNPKGKKSWSPGYYLHIEPGACFAASGVWMPEAKELATIRQEIDYNFAEFKKIINHKNFTFTFPKGLMANESLVRPPKGYDENNPAIDFIKLKSFVVSAPLKDEEVQEKNFEQQLLKIFAASDPLNAFLNEAFQ